jgi:hypothetical protein
MLPVHGSMNASGAWLAEVADGPNAILTGALPAPL